jgi:hypothetical protein
VNITAISHLHIPDLTVNHPLTAQSVLFCSLHIANTKSTPQIRSAIILATNFKMRLHSYPRACLWLHQHEPYKQATTSHPYGSFSEPLRLDSFHPSILFNLLFPWPQPISISPISFYCTIKITSMTEGRKE